MIDHEALPKQKKIFETDMAMKHKNAPFESNLKILKKPPFNYHCKKKKKNQGELLTLTGFKVTSAKIPNP